MDPWIYQELRALRDELNALKARPNSSYDFIYARGGPTDHFAQPDINASWSWIATAPFDGAPTAASTTAVPSHLVASNNDLAEDFFLAQTVSGTSIVSARLFPPLVGAYVGVRIDAGNDNDYAEIRFTAGTGTGTMKIQTRARTGGGAVTTTDFVDNMPAHPITFRLSNGSSAVGYYCLEPHFVEASGVAGFRFLQTIRTQIASAARAGIIFGLSSDTSRNLICDWAYISA